MKTQEKLKAILYWFGGIVLVFIVTALPLMLYLMAKVYDISPHSLSDLGSAWLSGSLLIAVLPALMVAFDVATDGQLKVFTDLGRKMLVYNPVGLLVALIVGAYFLRRKMFPPDGETSET